MLKRKVVPTAKASSVSSSLPVRKDFKAGRTDSSKYIHEFKSQWVHGYREVIRAAARRFNIPDLLVAGVAYSEVGGDPLWIDNIAYTVRSVDHLGDPVIEPMTVTKKPELTSFGNVSTQVRRAAEALGYGSDKLSNEQRGLIVSSLENPRENLFIAAKHLADLRDIDFRGKDAVSMTRDGNSGDRHAIQSRTGFELGCHSEQHELWAVYSEAGRRDLGVVEVTRQRTLLMAMVLLVVSWVLILPGLLVSVHEYDWSDEPELKELVRPEAILTIIALCVPAFLAAASSFIFSYRLKGSRWIRRLMLCAAVFALALCAYRLVEVLPLYTG